MNIQGMNSLGVIVFRARQKRVRHHLESIHHSYIIISEEEYKEGIIIIIGYFLLILLLLLPPSGRNDGSNKI